MTPARLALGSILSFFAILTRPAPAEVWKGDPSNYRALVSRLKPGDTLNLAPGTYRRLRIEGLNGNPTAWITIAGPSSDPPALIIGEPGFNTVEVMNSSFVAIEGLRIDSRGIPGAFGLTSHGHEDNLTHDIRIEGNTFVGQGAGQQTVAISTKSPTWGWVIRYNRILGAGTGVYLGESDGTQPFVAGVIEHNLIQDTIGYNLQIKDQTSIPEIDGMPSGPTTTIIRNNVFIKDDRPSPDGDRPNVLVGSFPRGGTGALSLYDIYGNVFVHNHREALFQGSGRVSLHDNLFVDGAFQYPAIVLRQQNHPLQHAFFFNNTVYTSGKGLYFGTKAEVDDAVVGNLIFAQTPISGSVMNQSNNLTTFLEAAAKYVNVPSFDPEVMDFYPLPGKCLGPPIDLSPFQVAVEYTRDFNGQSKIAAKAAVVFRGAYAGHGSNPGWRVQRGIKAPRPPAPPAPEVVWMSPAQGTQGTTVKVTLVGVNLGRDATVTVSGAGVTARPAIDTGSTYITIPLMVAGGAPPGIRQVTVQTASGASNPMTFQVRPR